MRQNLDLYDFEVTDADAAALATLHDGTRIGPNPATFN